MSWKTCEKVFIVMWQSEKTGCTYSDLRKTEEGKDKLVRTLIHFGYKDIIIHEQTKAWMPPIKTKSSKKGEILDVVDERKKAIF